MSSGGAGSLGGGDTESGYGHGTGNEGGGGSGAQPDAPQPVWVVIAASGNVIGGGETLQPNLAAAYLMLEHYADIYRAWGVIDWYRWIILNQARTITLDQWRWYV